MCEACPKNVYAYSAVGNTYYINEQIDCPECSERNDSALRDSHAISNWNMHEIQLYPWIIIIKEIQEKMGLKYRCPSCNQVISGVKLIRY